MRAMIRSALRVSAIFVLLAIIVFIGSRFFYHQATTAPVLAQTLAPIQLPTPQTSGGMPLMQALAARHTTRAFRDQPLTPQVLSNLLWAAFGVNRPSSIKPGLGRTAPSAMNSQDIELEVVLSQGAYTYDAEQNLLRPLKGGDLRPEIGPSAASRAAATIVFVAPVKDDSAQVDTGFIGQNIYLFAASEGLNAWFYTFHAQAVAATLGLPASRQPLYAESVGYPPQ